MQREAPQPHGAPYTQRHGHRSQLQSKAWPARRITAAKHSSITCMEGESRLPRLGACSREKGGRGGRAAYGLGMSVTGNPVPSATPATTLLDRGDSARLAVPWVQAVTW